MPLVLTPQSSKFLGFPSGALVIWQLPRLEKGQGACLVHLGPRMVSGKGMIRFQCFSFITERLWLEAASLPPPLSASEIDSWQPLGSRMVLGSEHNWTLRRWGQMPIVFNHNPETSRHHYSPQRPPCSTLRACLIPEHHLHWLWKTIPSVVPLPLPLPQAVCPPPFTQGKA